MQELNYITAANNGEGGWVQLLVFVVMAALWMLGGLIKARQEKMADKELGEEEENEDLFKFEKFEHPELETISQKQKPSEVNRSELKKARWQAQDEQTDKTDIGTYQRISEPVELQQKRNKFSLAAQEHQESELGREMLKDFHQPQELQKAILYSEIIGKPVSLRDH